MCSGFLGLHLCGRGRRWTSCLSPMRRLLYFLLCLKLTLFLCRSIGERRFLSIVRLAELEVALIDLVETLVFGDILCPLI